MAEELAALRDRGALDVVQVRASDLFGPGMHASALGAHVFARAVAGKGPRGFGDLDAPHTWTFVADAGAALAAAGTAERPPAVVHVPSASPRSYRQVTDDLAGLVGKPLSASATPPWMLRVLGWFVPPVGAMVEMGYEFDAPFVVADQVAREELGLGETPWTEALRTTVEAFRA